MKTYIATYFNMHAISYFIENAALHTCLKGTRRLASQKHT